MDHIVYLDSARELQQIIAGNKTILARASMGKKRPYGKVNAGDTLFFINIRTPFKVKAMANVKSAISSGMEKEVAENVKRRSDDLGGAVEEILNKKYIVMVEFDGARAIVPFSISECIHGGPGDWVVVKNIDEVIC